MTVTLSVWVLPLLVTLAIWCAAVFWPSEVRNDYDGFGRAFDQLLRLGLAVVATLPTWMIFFFLMWVAA